MKPSARLKWVLLFGCLLVWQVVVAHEQRLDELARNLIDNNASDEVALRAYQDWVSAQSEGPSRFSALPEGQSRFSALVDHIRKKTIPQRKLPAGSRQSGRLHLDPKKFRLMHLHMYKTGGSSVNQLFNAMCQTIPTRPCLQINSFHPNATLELNRFSLAEWSTDVTEAWRRKWARASWVWGHWWWPWTPALVELMPMDPARDLVVTVLRDPILTEISSMFYQSHLGNHEHIARWGAPKEPAALAAALAGVLHRFTNFTRDHYRVDFLARLSATPIDGWLLSYTAASSEREALIVSTIAAMHRLSSFAYVATTDDLYLFFRWFLNNFGRALTPQQAAQFTSLRANSASPLPDVSLEDLRLLVSLNRFTLFDRHLFLFASAIESVRALWEEPPNLAFFHSPIPSDKKHRHS